MQPTFDADLIKKTLLGPRCRMELKSLVTSESCMFLVRRAPRRGGGRWWVSVARSDEADRTDFLGQIWFSGAGPLRFSLGAKCELKPDHPARFAFAYLTDGILRDRPRVNPNLQVTLYPTKSSPSDF